MKVVNKCSHNATEFYHLKPGDTFYSPETNALYLKTEYVYDDCGDTITNAVNLRTGSIVAFHQHYNVIPVNCECVILDK